MIAKKPREWRGIFKLIEEMGEVQQVLGKIGPFPNEPHPDGLGNLDGRLEDELADLLAAIEYVIDQNVLDSVAINARAKRKLVTFRGWCLTGINTDPRQR